MCCGSRTCRRRRPSAEQVLVRVAATSINLCDWESLRRLPGVRTDRRAPLARHAARSAPTSPAGSRPSAPASPVPPGRRGVRRQPGTQGRLRRVRRRPRVGARPQAGELTFVEASTIPQAGAIALQGTAGAAAGTRVLINGAGGGTGTFAIQLAKQRGAHVTAVDNAGKLEFMRAARRRRGGRLPPARTSPGGSPTTSCSTSSPTARSFAYRRALAPGGRYRCVGGPSPRCWASLRSAGSSGG